ncbi:SDR family NAD(P)-dependent oxidoreductase [Prochlorococcus sp. MIT 0801]|uniref:SDR family NAD(P)-dependent oxidoreductase n=1 Tax=Prochlorococcus sp. MIT 0801 TaxID=1501269 RepID=UPI0004F8B688|nr:SDR family NAD(P)-dependent oxidoreductase [Prochlorococcus sp. MIT 0801]AIQ96832.1 Light-dependent protochlorophyllide reductase [Prochlorococcus sp. MIT 0801]
MKENSNIFKKDKPLTIFITGGSSGIGFQAVIKLISLGNNIILPCKNITRANEVLTNLFNYSLDKSSKKGEIYTPIMDLSDLNSIDSLCSEVKNRRWNIDVLIFNAGLQYTGSKTPRRSTQGIELTFAVNHLSHFYLTQKILPLIDISNDTKIIITSSEVHNPSSGGGKVGAKASLGNLKGLESSVGFEMIDGNKFNADKAYKDSKLCNILFARKLSEYFMSKKLLIPVIAWAPGLVISRDNQGFFRYSRKYNQLGQILFSFLARDILRITTSNKDAGLLLTNLACLCKYREPGFNYYSNRIISSGKFTFEQTEISNDAQRRDLSDKLWELSQSLIDKILK